MGALVARQWFLLGLLGALVLGAVGSRTITGILDRPEWTGAIVFGVMFLMALPLRTDDLWQTVRLELRRVATKAAWLLPLFALSLIIPVIGQAIYLLAGGYLLSKLTGTDYIDWCAARRGWSWKTRLAFANQHRWSVIGLGTAVVLSLMIPLAFVVVWPGAVAGGTILFTSLHQDSANPDNKIEGAGKTPD